MPSDNEDSSKKVKPASNGILDVSGLEVMLVLLNGSILLTVLLSLVFSIQHDLNYLESVAEVYKNVSADLIRFYGEEVRKSIRFLVYGVILISFLTGYQIYLIRRASERYPRLTAIYAISTALVWSFLLICIFELILFPGRGELKPIAALSRDVATNVIKSLTNLDMFRHWFCEVIFSVEVLVSLITLLYATWIFKNGFKENALSLLAIIVLCILSYYFLLTLPEVIVYRGPMEISSGRIHWFERPPLISIILPPKTKIISFRPDEISAFVKYWMSPFLVSIIIAVALLKDKMENSMKRIIRRRKSLVQRLVILIIILAIVGIVLEAVILPNEIDQSSVLYLSSAVLQAYAALIAIPFAIAAIHLQSKYGFVSTQVLFKRLKRIFLIFAVISFISVFSIVLSSNTSFLPFLLTIEIAVALAPLKFIVDFIKGIMFLKPSEILQDLGYPDKPAELLRQGKVFEAWNTLYQGFELARCCLVDPALHSEANIVIGKIAAALNKIDWTLEVRESRPNGSSLDISGILFNLMWILPTRIIEPIKTSTLKPDQIYVESLVRAITKGFIDSMKKEYKEYFDDFLEYVYKLTICYFEINRYKAWRIFESVFSITENYVYDKRMSEMLEHYVLPRIICCGLQIYNYAYERLNIRFTDFEEFEINTWFWKILDILQARPHTLVYILCLDALREAIRKNSEIDMHGFARVLVILAQFNHEKSKLSKELHKRADYIMGTLNKEVLEIISKKPWSVKLKEGFLIVLDESGAFGQVKLEDKWIQSVKEYLYYLSKEEA